MKLINLSKGNNKRITQNVYIQSPAKVRFCAGIANQIFADLRKFLIFDMLWDFEVQYPKLRRLQSNFHLLLLIKN